MSRFILYEWKHLFTIHYSCSLHWKKFYSKKILFIENVNVYIMERKRMGIIDSDGPNRINIIVKLKPHCTMQFSLLANVSSWVWLSIRKRIILLAISSLSFSIWRFLFFSRHSSPWLLPYQFYIFLRYTNYGLLLIFFLGHVIMHRTQNWCTAVSQQYGINYETTPHRMVIAEEKKTPGNPIQNYSPSI